MVNVVCVPIPVSAVFSQKYEDEMSKMTLLGCILNHAYNAPPSAAEFKINLQSPSMVKLLLLLPSA